MSEPTPRDGAGVVVRPMRAGDIAGLAASSRAASLDMRRRLGLPIPPQLDESAGGC